MCIAVSVYGMGFLKTIMLVTWLLSAAVLVSGVLKIVHDDIDDLH